METTIAIVPCKICKTKVPYTDLRRNKEGLYVCNNCLGRSFYDVASRAEEFRKPLQSKVKRVFRDDEKIAYVCNSCKFSFTKPMGSEDKNCPMCGKDYGVQRKQSAAELLRDVEDIFGE